MCPSVPGVGAGKAGRGKLRGANNKVRGKRREVREVEGPIVACRPARALKIVSIVLAPVVSFYRHTCVLLRPRLEELGRAS
jgi:hypothetical protein